MHDMCMCVCMCMCMYLVSAAVLLTLATTEGSKHGTTVSSTVPAGCTCTCASIWYLRVYLRRCNPNPNPNPNPTQVPVSLFGQPSVPIERSDLAEWCGGAADDFGADEWSWMGP